MPIDYSKWKNIEVSDDEDDTHPNVDTPSLFRWRHQARVERMEQKQKDREDLEHGRTKTQREIAELQQRLAESATLEQADREKLSTKLSELKKQDEQFRAKETELERQERLTPWNVDTIGQDGFSKSRINKIQPPTAGEETMTEEERHAKSIKFYKDNKKAILEYAMLRKWDDTKQYLLDNSHLCCEDTANYLTIECLNNEMEGKHDLMEHMSHQTIVMNFLLELAKELKYSAQAPQLISMFFEKLKKAEKTYHDAFEDELKSFKDRIVRRAKEKMDEAMKEYEEEERKKRIGPGGLDPVEVFESLPPEMQRCFEEQNIEALKDVTAKMPADVFRKHLDRCIASGLWVPEGGVDKDAVAGGSETPADEEQKETELRKRNTASSKGDN